MKTGALWLMTLAMVGAATTGCGSTAGAGAVNGGGGSGSGGGGGGGGSGGVAGATTDAGGDAGWSLDRPETPDVIDAPPGATVIARFRAIGVQIYTCAGSPGAGGATTYAWTLKAPQAVLYDATGAEAGAHGAGPSWTASDGSSVKGMKLREAPAPVGDAIPWLLLRATSNTGAGLFADVTFVQRVNTSGGKAPATGCDATTAPTEESRAQYSADYYFYRGGAEAGPADGGQPASPDGAATSDAGPDATDAGAEPPRATQYALVGTYLGGISAFAISPGNGSLAGVTGSPFAVGARLYGVAADPSGTFVYTIDLDRKVVDGYRLAPDSGVLTALPAAHAELGGASPMSISMEPQGRFLYVATTGDDAIHGFSVDPDSGALTPLARSPFLLTPFVPNGTVAVDPAGRFLYVTGTDTGIRAFSIDATSGNLAEIAGSPFARTVVFRGAMAFHPTGAFMYNGGPALNGFRVDPDTGALTALPGSPVVSGVGSDGTATTVAIDPRGRYLYVTATFTQGPLADTVSAYTIDSTTGALRPVPGSPFAAAPFPYSVAVDRDGRFVYVGNDGDLVSAFSVDEASGALIPVAGSPFQARGLQPEIVTVRPVRR